MDGLHTMYTNIDNCLSSQSVVAHSVELLEKELTEAKMSVVWAQREAEQQSKSITNAERIVANAKKMVYVHLIFNID